MLLKIGGIIVIFGLFTYTKATQFSVDECRYQPWTFPNLKSKCSEGVAHCRVRKEFTHMTMSERCRYINAVLRISTEAPFKKIYKNLLCIHKKHFDELHGGFTNLFLPFHRWIMSQYETLLRRADCWVTIPYWDWSADAAHLFESEVWNVHCALGGNGNNNFDHMVDTGPFRGQVWPLIPYTDSHYLQRNFAKNMSHEFLEPAYVLSTLFTPTFFGFSNNIENTYHSDIHDQIGGLMPYSHSIWAPEFFFHHGFVDKLWHDWEFWCGTHHSDMMQFFKHNDTKLIGTVELNSSSVFNMSNLPGNICVKYKTYDDLPLTKLTASIEKKCRVNKSASITVSKLEKGVMTAQEFLFD